MAQTYYPFDSGSGANVTEIQWGKMAQHWADTGIVDGTLNQLEVFADSSGMQVKVKSGAAWIKGHYYESDAEETLSIGISDATNPRIDRVIVRLDWIANIIELAVLQGVASVTPVAPDLTQNTSRWEIPLAQITVGANVVTIANTNVKNEGFFTDNYSYTSVGTSTVTKQSLATGVTHKLLYNRTINDSHGQHDTANSKFIAKKDGMYQVNIGAFIETPKAYSNFELKLYRNGAFWINLAQYRLHPETTAATEANIQVSGSSTIPLASGDYIEVYLYVGASTTENRYLSSYDGRYNYFNVIGVGGRKYD